MTTEDTPLERRASFKVLTNEDERPALTTETAIPADMSEIPVLAPLAPGVYPKLVFHQGQPICLVTSANGVSPDIALALSYSEVCELWGQVTQIKRILESRMLSLP